MSKANRFDGLIIGFGKGGKTLASALGAAGKKTAMIEQSPEMYGGTCINVGCIPTKRLVHEARQAALSGGSFEQRAEIYRRAVSGKDELTSMLRAKNLNKLSSDPNVTVITGRAKFASPHCVEVALPSGTSEVFEADNIFINTGSRPFIPPIAGIDNNPYVYTSEQLLALRQLPRELVIIGGGYIGVEFASFYSDFGSRVTVIQDGGRFLPREDDEIADAVQNRLSERGVSVMTGANILQLAHSSGRAEVTVETDGQTAVLQADAVLIATGRKPNTDRLELQNAGVELNQRGGIIVDDSLRTTAPHIFAMGDVVGGLQFTYISLDDFRIVRSAVLGNGEYTLKQRGAVPYSVFLNPPFSRVGLSEREALEKGYQIAVARLPAAAIPKSQVVKQPAGLLKAVIDRKTGLILGAHLLCEESHEMINLVKLAIDSGLPYTALRDMVYTHPTMSEAFNDLFNI